ncbi:hypothetical protein I5M32_00895 [Pedobacter sp. SD-b]|uniref:Uncharacterized protein n=1 Tax=Pedobacter segetis TaxID=2793069 RepID=A0ABS1BF50_9SPHI|nr:hypothetical protein [Pedobacter segetis]MBK0381502.1 hypothetical protein [Pedobacter segetis]
MIIPSSSEILIDGISVQSLAFAVILSANGAKVLMVDEQNGFELPCKFTVLDDYCLAFLTESGFEFSSDELREKQIDLQKFIAQALKLLAKNLCNVIWEGKIIRKSETVCSISNNGNIAQHTTSYILKQEIFQSHIDLIDIRLSILLAWRLIGIYTTHSLQKKIIDSYKKEAGLLKTQYHLKNPTSKRNILQKWFGNLFFNSGGFNLIDSKTSLHLSQYRNIQAGELLPNLSFFDEHKKTSSKLYDWCSYGHFSVIIFGTLSQTNLYYNARWLKLHYPVQLFYMPYSEKNQPVFDALNIRNGEKKTLLIRPDKYIGLLHDGVDIEIIDNYLQNFIYMNQKGEKAFL